MNRITLIIFLTFISGCISTKSVGGYEIFGKVIDQDSGKPLEGVRVSAYFTAIGAFSDDSRTLVSTKTDKEGNFSMVVPKTRLWGGAGLSGHVSEWPSIHYTKQGHCKSGASFIEPTLQKYQGMQLELQGMLAGGCI